MQSGVAIKSMLTHRIHKSGRLVLEEITTSPIKNDQGELIGVYVFGQDVTLKRQAVENLREYEKKFKDFVEATDEWFWEVDANYVFTYSNSSVQRILGYGPEEVIGASLFTFLSKEVSKNREIEMQNKSLQKDGWSLQVFQWAHKNGATRYLESNAHPVFDLEKKWSGFRGADRDVTDRLNMERIKDEFVSMISHELRTPLTAIHGALGLLSQGEDLDEDRKQLVDVSFRNSERLVRIVNNIVTIQRLHLGQLQMHVRQENLAAVIDMAVSSAQSDANKVQINLSQEDISPAIYVNVDKDLLFHVFVNLLSNAIKFSPPSSRVVISTQIKEESVTISVSDQGRGISEDFVSKMFSPFLQEDARTAREGEGTGLGLYLCKKIIEVFNGSLFFKTKQGEGSIFYVTLPLSHKE